MHRRLPFLLACAMPAGLAAACLGSTSPPAANGPRPTAPITPAPPPATRVVLHYTAGRSAPAPRAVPTRCPALARCRVVPTRSVRPRAWVLEVSRTLTCGPAGGAYRNPVAACRALRDYARRLAHRHAACPCALMIGPPGRATGDMRGRAVDLPVDDCTACGLGGRAAADVRTLIPG